MKKFTIDGTPRTEVGKKASKADRVAGRIPCVLYGGSNDTVHFTTTISDVRKLVYTSDFYKIALNIDGKSTECLLKDITFHPTTEEIVHMDFHELVPGAMVNAEIPINIVGSSEGVRIGGKLLVKVRKLKVKSTPEALKDVIDVDISSLKLGQSVKVKDLPEQGFQIINAPNIPIASIEIPRALRSAGAKAEKK
ncbi:MAG TPA: 50S ribosomal protein L25/general stress protein Ctc [Chitinophagales bacterium]|nr:50S ribosomal protein L25/general stress protein Ctc [Chitinophagales bacterium]